MIKEGKYKPGEKLPAETKLSEMFNVSRPPIREALRVLEASGVIKSKQGGGSVVQPISITNLMEKTTLEMVNIDEVLHLLEVRIILESQTAVLAAKRRDDRDLECIQEALNDMRLAIDNEESIGHKQDIDFHTAIVKAAHNPVLQQTMDGISNLYYSATKFSLKKNVGLYQKRQQVLQEHENIAEAIRLQDEEAAKEAMSLHLKNARLKLEKY
ncbi:GntR family transcriptional repressor for pyruvate dehydrogenase complex [Scopulibacillus darangshiensis]|uniref:GntR family transcriptional repressor for pyruvate dehydrogenase complex n=2 Tax=Scopulibacillus darangshiensis TaxID=442528 RepID=A0A4R2P457_9BACL|nr:GntR family transcriptional repressor for pyruvate dehydrogenase complex [Scopulibacillus darangshiensis]